MTMGHKDRKIAVIVALIVILSILAVDFAGSHETGNSTNILSKGHGTVYSLKPVPSLGGTTDFNSSAYTGNIGVDIIFNFSNQNSLNSLLNNLSNPASSQFQHYLTASQFNSLYDPSESTYSSSISYFSQYGLNINEKFPNRLVLAITGSAANFSRAFHTNITGYSNGAVPFFAPNSLPMLPSWLSTSVNTVIGLNSQYSDTALNLNIAGLKQFSPYPANTTGKPVPASSYSYPVVHVQKGIQFFYGSQLQPAYNETPLLNKVLPRNEVIATLLWGGSYKSGGKTIYTGPYNPSDLSFYFNKTLASTGEPLPKVYGVPVSGAVAPGTSAQNDTSGAVVENTLDLEMAGSLAPGASIYNAYGQNSTLSDVTLAFEEVLSPPSQYSGLDNVSVISNSWGSNDTVVTQWNQLLKECQARGITVLASTGDSGNDYNSAKSVSNTEYVQFPSTAAYNSYGVVAVGGTNISVNANQVSSSFLSMVSQQAWYEPAPQFSSATLGTVGGISNLYTEPIWQLDSQANNVIKGAGRAVPDISAIANNTIIYFSNTSAANYYVVSGTSISAPVSAGIIAEMNAYRAAEHLGNLGFLDPYLYFLGTQQYGNSLNKPYLTPFFDVTSGHNMVYSALKGYDLVTGMGSMNAYNIVTDLSQNAYNVSFRETGLPSNTQWYVQVNGVEFNSTGTYLNVSLINGTYNFQVQNIGNKVAEPTGGNVTVSGASVNRNLVFVTGYTVTFSESKLPAGTSWYIQSWNYTRATFSNQISLLFPSGTHHYTVHSGDPNYYGSSGVFGVGTSPQTVKVNFTLGTFNVSFVEAGLPSGQNWMVKTNNITQESTNTYLNFSMPGGEHTFTVPASGAYIGNYTTLTMNTDGTNRTFYLTFGYGYFVSFNLSGLPSGKSWNLLISTYNVSNSSNTITVELQNGTYNFYAYYFNGEQNINYNGNVTVSGSNMTVNLTAGSQPINLEYYAFYGALFIVGFAVLGIGFALLRKK